MYLIHLGRRLYHFLRRPTFYFTFSRRCSIKFIREILISRKNVGAASVLNPSNVFYMKIYFLVPCE